jgi:hypothetical protein
MPPYHASFLILQHMVYDVHSEDTRRRDLVLSGLVIYDTLQTPNPAQVHTRYWGYKRWRCCGAPPNRAPSNRASLTSKVETDARGKLETADSTH